MENEYRLPLEDRVMPDPKLPEKRGHKKISAPAMIGIVAGALALCYVVICTVAALRQTVYPHTTLLGVDMGGLTVEEAAEKWKKECKTAYDGNRIALVEDTGR